MQSLRVKTPWSSGICLLLALTLVGLANGQSPNVHNGTTVVHQTKDEPIVVQTPLQNYDLPTLKEYEECQQNRQQCENVCAGRETCLNECPLCPDLYLQPHVVQGINDTDVKPGLLAVPVNATHVIKLTNEINNIIENKINSANTNNIQVHQNVSNVGGRFGLGYNEHGSCCFVIQRPLHCEGEQPCADQKRHRVCGERCQARVMEAKRVMICTANEPDSCEERIEYMPARRRTHSHHPAVQPAQSGCRYLGNFWPYVSCNDDQYQQYQRNKRNTVNCQRCLELPYGYILRSGLPAQCGGCFNVNAPPMMPMWYAPLPMVGGYNAPAHNLNSNYDYWNQAAPKPEHGKIEQTGKVNDDSGWILDTRQCMQPNGEWAECDSENESGSGSGSLVQPQTVDASDYKNEDIKFDYEDADYNIPAQRRRRHHARKFQRSLYSHRQD